MKALVIGASGATGSLVVQQLIERNIDTKIVVRDISKVSKDIQNNGLVEIVTGSIYDFDKSEYLDLIRDCDAVVSCLGHNISLKGIFGKPRLLVTGCLENICEAIEESKKTKVKVILMSTTANINRKINEKYFLKDRIVLSLLNILLPPQKDNVRAAEYLSYKAGENNSHIEWTCVRPDTLINKEETGSYEIYESPKSSPVFAAGKTSRIDVAHFMAELLSDEGLWEKWKFKMPVIYSRSL